MTNDGYKQNCHDIILKKKKLLHTKQHTHINIMTVQILPQAHTIIIITHLNRRYPFSPIARHDVLWLAGRRG